MLCGARPQACRVDTRVAAVFSSPASSLLNNRPILLPNLPPVESLPPPFSPNPNGYFAAAFSSTSIPHPGASFTYQYPSFITGHPWKTSCVRSLKGEYSCTPKFGAVTSSVICAACPIGDTSPGPCHALRTPNCSANAIIFLAGDNPRHCEFANRPGRAASCF
jgi:hypothetical protein